MIEQLKLKEQHGLTKLQGKKLLREFLELPYQGTAFALLMKDEEGFSFYPRTHQPCYGELRPFSKKENRPGDLHHPFPKGVPVGLSIPIGGAREKGTEYFDFCMSSESPWYPVLRHVTIVDTPGDGITVGIGLLFDHCKFSPTLLINFLLIFKNMSSFKYLKKKFPSEDLPVVHLMSLYVRICSGKPRPNDASYVLRQDLDVHRFLNNIPLEEGTLEERTPYERRDLNKTFGTSTPWVYAPINCYSLEGSDEAKIYDSIRTEIARVSNNTNKET